MFGERRGGRLGPVRVVCSALLAGLLAGAAAGARAGLVGTGAHEALLCFAPEESQRYGAACKKGLRVNKTKLWLNLIALVLLT